MEQKKLTTSESLFYARKDRILNECLRQMFSAADENQAIDTLLSYVGRTFDCERVYIFEKKDEDKVCRTYEWCSQEVIPPPARTRCGLS